MEIKNKHQLMIAAALILLVAVWLWPPVTFGAPERIGRDPVNPFRQSAENLTNRLHRTESALRISEQVQHALETHEANQVEDGLAIIGGEGVPANALNYVRTQMQTHWQEIATSDAARVAVAVHLDVDDLSNSWRRRGSDTTYRIIPVTGVDGPACVMLINISESTLNGLTNQPDNPERSLRHVRNGPMLGLSTCAFYAAFGAPGAGIIDWLDRTEGHFAAFGHRAVPRKADVQESWDNAAFWRFNTRALSCTAGHQSQCGQAVLDIDRHWPAQPGFAFVYMSYLDTFGPNTGYFLADAVHNLGPDRFRAAWTSRGTLPEAFASATGQTLGAYTHQWADSFMGPVNHTGRLHFGRMAFMGLIAGIGLFGAGLASARRTI